MKATRIESQIVKILKPLLLSEKKSKEKRQSTVEDIIRDVDANNDVVYTQEFYSSKEYSSEESYHQTLKKKKLL